MKNAITLDSFSEETGKAIKNLMFNAGIDDLSKAIRIMKQRMRKDIKNGCTDGTRSPYLAHMLNSWVNRYFKVDDPAIQEIWKVCGMSKEVLRSDMKRLEREIDMSDLPVTCLFDLREQFRPYGYLVCKEKSGMLRLQPWAGVPNRYYLRASRAIATAKVRMLGIGRICTADTDRLLERVKAGEEGFKVDYTKGEA